MLMAAKIKDAATRQHAIMERKIVNSLTSNSEQKRHQHSVAA